MAHSSTHGYYAWALLFFRQHTMDRTSSGVPWLNHLESDNAEEWLKPLSGGKSLVWKLFGSATNMNGTIRSMQAISCANINPERGHERGTGRFR